ncbi:MAG: SUMF1/EgtB/PvdO family nonheme iron enzyme [Myxococcales bacterium]|nr:SUMF1/EgtB/PvdO family nonheme iron enzyme [Myxococcales bacterium]
MRRRFCLPLVLVAACSLKAAAPPPPRDVPDANELLADTSPTMSAVVDGAPFESDGGPPDASLVKGALTPDGGDAYEPPLHKTSAKELLALFTIRPLTQKETARILPEPFLAQIVGVGTPAKIHQGNPTISTHDVSRRACLAGLEGTVLQTSEQRARCGHDNMVPVHLRGKDPYFCIDIFEFPNRPCELPFVWASPTYAKKLCELQGKRLCSQIEWQLACRADPNDGPDTVYAYGDTLDLDACHTKKRHRQVAEKPCTTTDAPTTYRTCPTDTEPSGSFPKCRSRYGVYDLHGNVAEIMMRRDGDGTVKSQLKGSAWFYDEVAREVSGPPLHPGSQGAYPDHCNFDPRWHVEPIENAWHVNYHLGFRCCASIP